MQKKTDINIYLNCFHRIEWEEKCQDVAPTETLSNIHLFGDSE